MTRQKRQAMLIAVMVAMLAVAVAWNTSWMLRKRDIAQRAVEDLAACKALASEIVSFGEGSAARSTESVGSQRLSKRIGAACEASAISYEAKPDGPSLDGVFPQSAQRAGDTQYMQMPTSLALRSVSLPQLATFLYHLTDESGLSVRDLRLRGPRGDAPPDAWDVEATVTYLVYASQEDSPDQN